MIWDVVLHTLQPYGVLAQQNTTFEMASRLLLLSAEAQDRPDTIYVTGGGGENCRFRQALIVCVGGGQCDCPNCIVVERGDLFQVFNALMMTKLRLDELDTALLRCSSEQEIVDKASDAIGLPMFYLDESYRILAITNIAIDGDPEWKHMSEKRYLSPESARKMKQQGDLDLLAPSLVPLIYRSKIYPFDSIVCNIWKNGKFVSRLNVLCVDGDTSPLVRRFSEIITGHLKRLITQNQSAMVGSPVHRIVLDLLHGAPLSEEMIRESLKSLPGMADKLFRLFYIDVKAGVDRQLAAYYATLLKQQASDMSLICVEFKEHLAVLLCGEDEQEHDAQIVELCRFLASHSLRCGVSNPFRGLSALQGYFRQAAAALEQVGEEGVQFYQDIMLGHMLSFIPEEQTAFLISPDIARLQKAEGEFSFSLLKTLQVYLDCDCNLNRAAERLFIHKNTLLYRMNHIRSVIRCDLNDPDERLLLVLSFKLLER